MEPVVLDCGSFTFKAGYANPDIEPPVIVPNRFCLASDAVECASAPDQGLPCIHRGKVLDWEIMEDAWHHLLYTQLGWEEGNEGSIFLCEPVLTSRLDRELSAQLLFETFGAAGLAVAEQPLLCLYAMGRLSGCCVDIGHGKIDVAMVHDGAVIPSSTRRWAFGISDMARLLLQATHSAAASPADADAASPGSASLQLAAPDLESLKAAALVVAADAASFQKAAAAQHMEEFALPDGQVIKTDASRWRITEALFSPRLLGSEQPGLVPLLLSAVLDGSGTMGSNAPAAASGPGGGGFGLGSGGMGGGMGGSGGVVSAEVMRQRAALEAVAVVGGGSGIAGLTKRLERELEEATPASMTPALVKAPEYMPDTTAQYASWIGGSIAAKIVFQQNQHVTRGDYDERGPFGVHRKCL